MKPVVTVSDYSGTPMEYCRDGQRTACVKIFSTPPEIGGGKVVAKVVIPQTLSDLGHRIRGDFGH